MPMRGAKAWRNGNTIVSGSFPAYGLTSPAMTGTAALKSAGADSVASWLPASETGDKYS